MLSTLAVTCMTFLSVSGGPLGMETAMNDSSIHTVLALCTWVLFTYMIPIAFMTYEMTLFQDKASGGPINWVYKALGKRWGVCNAIWDIGDTLIDNAIYPALFADNIVELGVPLQYKHYLSWACIVAVFFINYEEFEGTAAIVLTTFILAPYLYLMFLTPVEHMWTMPTEPTFFSWQKTLTIITWNVNGLDMSSPYAYMVREPRATYAISILVNTLGVYLMMVIFYCLGTYYVHIPNDWKDGTFIDIGEMAGGPVLKFWLGLSAAAASFGVLTVELCSTSHLFRGLTTMGLSNKFENTKFNLILNCLFLIGSVMVDLSTLIQLSAFLNVFTLTCELIAWLKTFQYTYTRLFGATLVIINNLLVIFCIDLPCFVLLGLAVGLGIASNICISNTR